MTCSHWMRCRRYHLEIGCNLVRPTNLPPQDFRCCRRSITSVRGYFTNLLVTPPVFESWVHKTVVWHSQGHGNQVRPPNLPPQDFRCCCRSTTPARGTLIFLLVTPPVLRVSFLSSGCGEVTHGVRDCPRKILLTCQVFSTLN